MAVIGLSFILLLRDLMPADFVMVFSLATLLFAQVIPATEGLEGFASPAVLAVAVLYVVAAGISSTGALDYLMNKVLGAPVNAVFAQARLMFPVAVISAFMNNTPVVAIMIPIVQQWAERIRIPPSQLFIPLSFASVLGGTCTLIGTSTNLVIAGRAEEEGTAQLGLFDIGIVGVPVLFTGMLYILIFSPFLLPDKAEIDMRAKKALGLKEENSLPEGLAVPPGIGSDFTVTCLVNSHSDVCGKAVDEAGLRGLDGLYLTSVQRDGRLFNAIGPEFVIHEYDILHFTGLVEAFPSFCLKHGFTPVTEANEESIAASNQRHNAPRLTKSQVDMNIPLVSSQSSSAWSVTETEKGEGAKPRSRLRRGTFNERLIKVIVRSTGELVGHAPKEVDFRHVYNAAILSLHREGEMVRASAGIGRVLLGAGDILLLLTGDEFSWDDEKTARDLKLLPTTEKGKDEDLEETFAKEFLIPMIVSDSSKLKGTRSLVGQTIEQAGLRGLPGLFLIAIEHPNGDVEHAVGPKAELKLNDTLWFAGERSSIGTLRRIPGLMSPEQDQFSKLKVDKLERRLVECVISPRSDMVGKTVREARFRTRFEAAIITIHRSGRRILSKVGDIELKPGDVLILDTGPYFLPRYRDDSNFLLVAEIENSTPPRFDKFYIALAAVIGMMVVFTVFSEVVTLFECAVYAAGAMVVFGCITPKRARAAISWDVIVTIACAFGWSNALEVTNVANTTGGALVDLAEITGTGEIGVLYSIYLATFLISIVVANNAAALLMYPVAIEAATRQQIPVNKVLFTLMLSASSSFTSPFGYQTNLMVFGPGNYIFLDYVKFGLPMQFWQMVFSVLYVFFDEFWYIHWLVSFSALVLFFVIRALVVSNKSVRGIHTVVNLRL